LKCENQYHRTWSVYDPVTSRGPGTTAHTPARGSVCGRFASVYAANSPADACRPAACALVRVPAAPASAAPTRDPRPRRPDLVVDVHAVAHPEPVVDRDGVLDRDPHAAV